MNTRSHGAAMAPILTLVAILLAAAPAAGGVDDFPGQTEREIRPAPTRAWTAFDEVRAATGRYHDIHRAIADGYVHWKTGVVDMPTCTDTPTGGGATRYLRDLDGRLDPLQPEVLVYEPTPDGQSRLVAVEYMLPAMFVEDSSENDVATPEVLGNRLREHRSLRVYVLRAWIWKDNPLGTFAEAHPGLSDCTPV